MRTGYRLALGVVIVTVVAAIALFVVEAVGANRDAHAYGQVSNANARAGFAYPPMIAVTAVTSTIGFTPAR